MINAVVAEDHVLMRAGIVAALGAIDGVTVVDECGSKDALLAAVDRSAPDLVVTDIRMPPTHTSEGIDAARAIRASSPSTAVLVLSEYVEPGYVVSLFEDGAASLGYLLKSNVGDLGVLRRAIATVCGGGLSIDPEVVAAMVGAKEPSVLDVLTGRERDVLGLMSEGLDNQAIAADLVIAEKSVQKHINTIFAKLHLGEETGTHRRVRAVLLWLTAQSQSAPITPPITQP